jgi:hypothetical protein
VRITQQRQYHPDLPTLLARGLDWLCSGAANSKGFALLKVALWLSTTP